MRFLKNLYIGEKAKKNAAVHMDEVRSGRRIKDLYVLIAPLSAANQLEIIQPHYLRQRYYIENEPLIVGIAIGKDEALGLVTEIAQGACEAYNTPDIRRYISQLSEGGDAHA